MNNYKWENYECKQLRKLCRLDKEKWIAIQEKISNYIARKFPDKIKKYDIFSPEYKRKSYVKKELKALDNKTLFGSKKSNSKTNKHFYLKWIKKYSHYNIQNLLDILFLKKVCTPRIF